MSGLEYLHAEYVFGKQLYLGVQDRDANPV